ncbi:PDZ domain-containing protein [Cellulomonas sp. S1-8]|uniref:YlbL family protein n=1 Tax=Cellulomonas sp. S1-8 TaxID=2904790 RepID=UPI002244F0AA|nr:S16 family serine protease [Cellulomonas sp. S1-8]UZN02052.1 PDZ domain-containing protein [Cellulomonas sp. S1-8]
MIVHVLDDTPTPDPADDPGPGETDAPEARATSDGVAGTPPLDADAATVLDPADDAVEDEGEDRPDVLVEPDLNAEPDLNEEPDVEVEPVEGGAAADGPAADVAQADAVPDDVTTPTLGTEVHDGSAPADAAAPAHSAPADAAAPAHSVPADDPVLSVASRPADELEESPEGEPDGFERPRPTPRALVLSFGMLAVSVLVGILAVVPAPYAVNGPGPTKDVLGEVDGTPLIEVDGAETFPSTGELLLTTISGTGGPGYPAYALNVLQGWFSPSSLVRPVEEVYPQDLTQEEIDESNAGQMVSSYENASVAALTELGYEVPATLVVAGTVEGTDAEGKLEEGDVLTALDGVALPDYQLLVERLEEVVPGDTVTLTVTRHSRALEVPVVTGEREDGGAQIGVFIDPSFDMPLDVSISIDGIGGPSAGTMFALGIVDLLTPEDEAAGQVIAGTGTIDVTGAVGPIGGIRQKLFGAVRDGATWFLAPAGNCEEVVGHVPDGLRVVEIATLHEAREAMTAIGAGTADDLPTCTAD